jgi:hypothetical protein
VVARVPAVVLMLMARSEEHRYCIVISNLIMVRRHIFLDFQLILAGIVFLDENNRVKLGDFGLSKALAQASFANTYVGVRSVSGLYHCI